MRRNILKILIDIRTLPPRKRPIELSKKMDILFCLQETKTTKFIKANKFIIGKMEITYLRTHQTVACRGWRGPRHTRRGIQKNWNRYDG